MSEQVIKVNANNIRIRDLYASNPDDYAEGTHDLQYTDAQGKEFYVDSLYSSFKEAHDELATAIETGIILNGDPEAEHDTTFVIVGNE